MKLSLKPPKTIVMTTEADIQVVINEYILGSAPGDQVEKFLRIETHARGPTGKLWVDMETGVLFSSVYVLEYCLKKMLGDKYEKLSA